MCSIQFNLRKVRWNGQDEPGEKRRGCGGMAGGGRAVSADGNMPRLFEENVAIIPT